MVRAFSAPGVLALPVAAAASLLAVAVAASGAERGGERVELEVAGVVPVAEDGACILVLREKGAATLLPLMLPGFDARRLGLDLEAHRAPGLVGEAILALGARVLEVEIAELEETSSAARVRLAQGARRVELSGKPSESIALARSAGAPIFTTRRVLDAAGLAPEELQRARARPGGRMGALQL